MDIPRHMLRGKIVRVYAAVQPLDLAVVPLRAQVQAVKVYAEQGALIVQHPEAVALVKGNAPSAQVIFTAMVLLCTRSCTR